MFKSIYLKDKYLMNSIVKEYVFYDQTKFILDLIPIKQVTSRYFSITADVIDDIKESRFAQGYVEIGMTKLFKMCDVVVSSDYNKQLKTNEKEIYRNIKKGKSVKRDIKNIINSIDYVIKNNRNSLNYTFFKLDFVEFKNEYDTSDKEKICEIIEYITEECNNLVYDLNLEFEDRYRIRIGDDSTTPTIVVQVVPFYDDNSKLEHVEVEFNLNIQLNSKFASNNFYVLSHDTYPTRIIKSRNLADMYFEIVTDIYKTIKGTVYERNNC